MTLTSAEKPSDTSDTEHDEATLVSALNHLQNMHIQVKCPELWCLGDKTYYLLT